MITMSAEIIAEGLLKEWIVIGPDPDEVEEIRDCMAMVADKTLSREERDTAQARIDDFKRRFKDFSIL